MLHASAWRICANPSSLADAAAVLLSLSGALPVGAAPQHWAHSPAHGLFLLAIGLGELVWAGALWRARSPGLRTTGALLAGGSIVLWAITRVLPAPFGHGPEVVGPTDVASKLPEVLVLGVLILDGVRAPADQRVRAPAWVHVAGLLGVAAVAGMLTFWLATAAEPALPWLRGGLRDEGAVPAAPLGGADRLQLVVAGIGTPLASGDELPMAGDLLAQITLASGEARFGRDLRLRLLHSTGAPASDATIVATGHMRFMDHGSFRQAATPSGDGQYVLPVRFAMPGEWLVDVEIATPAQRGTIQLELDLVE